MTDKVNKNIPTVDPKKLAEELVGVQPMPEDTIKDLYELSKDTEKLVAEGYKPVSNLGLMWVKDSEEK